MEDVSQVFNKVLGRNQDVGSVRFWENPERAGWLMKQGRPLHPLVKVINSHAVYFLSGFMDAQGSFSRRGGGDGSS